MNNNDTQRLALVTGATGYVGGLLVGALLDRGWQVRVLVRTPGKLDEEDWHSRVDVVEGDAREAGDLAVALDGVEVAYYLLHSMDGEGDFRARDLALAQGFADVSAREGVGRIIYLSGLHPDDEELSPHLASRVEVGEVFLRCPVPAVVLQAAVVVGEGSASFRMLRFLAERLPGMVAPRWVKNQIQPIAADDVVHYLVGAADLPPELNRTFDVGGPEAMNYVQMIKRFAAVNNLGPRPILTLPVLTPGLASHWIGLVTPVDAGVAKPLVGSLIHDVVVKERDLAQYLPDPPGGLTPFDDAVRSAMRQAVPSPGRRNLAVAGAATLACALAGSLATDPDSDWYRSLDKPAWEPPRLAFPVVWTALYAGIAAVSASATTNLSDRGERDAERRYWGALGVNLALNAGWSALFFRARRPALAAVGAAALAISAADLANRAGKASPAHRVALLPYVGWCTFATLLNAEIARRDAG